MLCMESQCLETGISRIVSVKFSKDEKKEAELVGA